MVVPIEVPIETPSPVIEQALADLLGFLGAILAPVRRALFAAIRWLVAQWWNDVVLPVWHSLEHLNNVVANNIDGLVANILNLNQRVSNVTAQTVVTVQGVSAGAVQSLHDEIAGAENYVIGIAEDLYNRSVDYTRSVESHVWNQAWEWTQNAIGVAYEQAGAVRSYVNDLHNMLWGEVHTLHDEAIQVAVDIYGNTLRYTDTAVAQLEGEIADTKTLAEALAAAVGAVTLARAITIVKDLYDPCCEFTTDSVKPAWNAVKGMLGKLTRRGPLVLVVMGIASETVAGLDRKAIVKGLVESRAADHGASLQALLDWGGLTIGSN